jgi:hypothetical protein
LAQLPAEPKGSDRRGRDISGRDRDVLLLYAVIVLNHNRRPVIYFEVTQNPTQVWGARQIIEAFPWDIAPRYLLRDRDPSYDVSFQNRVERWESKDHWFNPW